uniref:Decorin binding protein A n=1 Tax=Borreliella garinii TaxID=29519 RepID=Q3MSR9_BORGR|nr:decorin binding protein A [Borreliella garinii]CAH56456.1 decorin binding protein A [Borreliella garinii]
MDICRIRLEGSISLTGKARLESSVKDIIDEIDKAIKEAIADGVKLNELEENKTGAKKGGPQIRDAKIRVINLSVKFLKEIEEEANILKDNVGMNKVDKDQLLKDMYDLMLNAAGSLQKLGLQEMIKTVTQAAEKTPPTTVEGILMIANTIEDKLKKIKGKQETNKK